MSWNVMAVLLPVVAIGIGLLSLGGSGTGDWAGRLGAGVLFVLGVSVACALGAIAAGISLWKGEPRMWLGVLGLIGNLAVVLPVLGSWLRR